MTAGVVAVGYRSGGFFPGPRPADELPPHLDRVDLDNLVERLRATIAEHGMALVIYPSWVADSVLQRLSTVRSALDTANLAFHPCALPPTRGAVLVSMAAAAAPLLGSAGILHASLPLLERQLIGLTWLTRLSALEDPAPSVGQHLLSLLPGTAFVATTWPQPAVRRLRKGDAGVKLPRLKEAAGVVFTDAGGDREWLRERIVAQVPDAALVELDPTELGPAYWGGHRHLEAVLHPVDLAATVHRAQSALQRTLCRWCRAEIAATLCPFCGMAATGYEAGEAA